MAEFPDAIASFRTVADRVGVVYKAALTKVFFAKDYNDLANEVVAIENNLGLNPEGIFTTVGDRLDFYDYLLPAGDIVGTTDEQTLTNKTITPDGWTLITSFSNSWVVYGGTVYSQPAYMKTPDGRVHLRGLIKSGSISSPAFTLPVGYRPLKREHFPCSSGGAFGIGLIYPTGDVSPDIGSNAWFSLNGISFSTT